VAEFHYPSLQPASQRRREDGQPRQQRLMADVVERPSNWLPPSRTRALQVILNWR